MFEMIICLPGAKERETRKTVRVFAARNPQTIRKSSYPSLKVNEETRSKKLRRFVRECPWTDSLLALLINVYVLCTHTFSGSPGSKVHTHTHGENVIPRNVFSYSARAFQAIFLFETSININIAEKINSQIITRTYVALFDMYLFFLISDKKFDHVYQAPQNPVIINKRARFEYVIFDRKKENRK